ncbi:MAG: hypothetical protein MJZ28_02320 [Paludibacteraceae bacterium]|nr:hypothetical protein [Paludibacteraceae bacterium]
MEANQKEKIDFYNSSTKLTYFAILIGGILATFLSYKFDKVGSFEPATIIMFQSISMLLMLAVIPLSLKYYKKACGDISALPHEEKVPTLLKAFTIRILANTIVLLLLNIVFLFTKDTSIFLCEVISLIVILFFCKPTHLAEEDLIEEEVIIEDEPAEEETNVQSDPEEEAAPKSESEEEPNSSASTEESKGE